MKRTVSTGEGSYGYRDVGGIDSHMFAKDGETLYLVRRPTWVFHSSVHMARLLKTCSHIHLPFRSLSITALKVASLQKMKRGYCLLLSNVTASAISALSCLFRICGSLSWQSTRNSRSLNI